MVVAALRHATPATEGDHNSCLTLSPSRAPPRSFVAVPVAAIQAKLAARKKDLQAEAEALRSRLHYLETTARNSQDHIDTLLKGGATG